MIEVLQEQRYTHSYQCRQYFRVSKNGIYGRQCLGFLTCVHMLMHAIAHGGAARKDIVREPALEVDSAREKKIHCRTGDLNPRQYCAWLFSRTFNQPSYPYPHSYVMHSLHFYSCLTMNCTVAIKSAIAVCVKV